VNAHRPGGEELVGAGIEGAAVDWPEGRLVSLGFSDRPLRAYEGRLELALDPTADIVTLCLQVCSDRLCLEPERASFRLR
jgi:hypothetical protein